jgi:hypothetical protein
MINRQIEGWWSGSSGKVPAYQARGLEFKPQYCKKKKKNVDRQTNEFSRDPRLIIQGVRSSVLVMFSVRYSESRDTNS